ncbi:UNVERIFIED_CONTAM: hypothetical protein GTU68_061522 [Idotea baltica]|nr:hypothetical protein [Idotea baltica]
MLPITLIREKADFVKERLALKNFDASKIIDRILEHDIERRALQTRLDGVLAESNKLSKEIGALYRDGKRAEADIIKGKTVGLKDQSKLLEDKMKETEQLLEDELVQLPNIPHNCVPTGNTDNDNVVIKETGEKPNLTDDAVPHWDLLEKYKLMSLEYGNKITGAGFPVFYGKGAKLQRALVAFFLDRAVEAGYTEYIPPLMVNKASAFGTGSLPDKEGQMYYVDEDDLYLIPTAEVPITNILRNELVKEDDLPIKMTGHSQCFRREAGSYGKDVRGLNRVHQFEKVEIVQFAHPDKSYEVLNEMMEYVSDLLSALGLPYRVLRLCGGDITFASALTYDFEVFSAGQNRWLEVSSVSNFEVFQSNRLKTRFKDKASGKTKLVHTLNGSAMALPRIIAALLENNQTPEGIVIPDVLRPYMGCDMIK